MVVMDKPPVCFRPQNVGRPPGAVPEDHNPFVHGIKGCSHNDGDGRRGGSENADSPGPHPFIPGIVIAIIMNETAVLLRLAYRGGIPTPLPFHLRLLTRRAKGGE